MSGIAVHQNSPRGETTAGAVATDADAGRVPVFVLS